MEASILEAITLNVSKWHDGDDEARGEIASKFDAAFRDFGIVLLTGYPTQEDTTVEALRTEAGTFFASSLEEKMRWNRGAYGNALGGYTPPGLESVAKSIGLEQKDSVESFTFVGPPSALNAAEVSPFQASAAAHWDGMCQTLRLVHAIAARVLGVEERFFDAHYFDTAAENGPNGLALKISWYSAPVTSSSSSSSDANTNVAPPATAEPRLRYGEHTDYQGFTLLRPDSRDWQAAGDGGPGSSGGLEFKHGHDWVPVAIPATPSLRGALAVNAGDLVRVWSNSRWVSPLHRVRASTLSYTEEERGSQERCSVVFFTGPAAGSVVRPICAPGEAPRHAPIKAGEHLQSKIAATRGAGT